MNKTGITLIVIVILVLLGVGVFAMMGNSSTTENVNVTVPAGSDMDNNWNDTASTTMPGATSTNSTNGGVGVGVGAGVSAGTVKEFTVTGSNFAFDPKTITVNKGDTVKIVFKNADGFHDLKIDEFNAATQVIKGGEQETITFVANKSGSFEYYCSVGNHRAMGMKGTLVVK